MSGAFEEIVSAEARQPEGHEGASGDTSVRGSAAAVIAWEDSGIDQLHLTGLRQGYAVEDAGSLNGTY